jgi:hypothetical protein
MTDTPASQTPSSHTPHHQSFWLWIMCLTGVDYFSTLGYQPSIAFENAGLLAPLATVLLVLVTLCGALPVYAHVAGESPHGQGSIGMLEHLMRGWWAKTFVLVLLGFAATDFVITKTLSAADAAEHLIQNPTWPWVNASPTALDYQRLAVTCLLLVLLGAVFMRGFREVIGLAVVIVGIYLVLNAVVIGAGLWHLASHPHLLIGSGPDDPGWLGRVMEGDWHLAHAPLRGRGPWVILATCLLIFPKLALGLSGFETGVAVMPLIKGSPDEDPQALQGRIRNTRKLLLTAALIMSVCLLGSSLVISTLIPPEAFERLPSDPPGKKYARDRALAYLAHAEGPHRITPLFGEVFGTAYDLSTIIILWFAGASAMAGLLNLVPQYLPRYGMAPEWARAVRPLVLMFTGINLLITWVFDASVSAQGGAYATGVLVLMTSACVATVIDQRHRRAQSGRGGWPWGYILITGVFLYTTGAIIIEKPDGLKIASGFILAIVIASFASRLWRSTELRFGGFQFADDHSRFLWESMKYLEVPVLVPHRPGRRDLESKEESIRAEHHLGPDVPIVFCEVEVGDPSEFYQEPVMEVTQQGGRFLLRIGRAASIAHVLAAIGLELGKHGKPPEIHFGWSAESPLAANLGFVLFGEGNVPWMVRELVTRAEPDPERQPRVIIG